MNIRSYLSLVCTPLACATLVPTIGSAQDSDVPTITVMTLTSNEQGLGAQAADALRDRLNDQFSSDELHTVPTADIATNLESSGFSIDDPLAPAEERQLANMLRADIYVSGKITHEMNGRYRFEARLLLPHELTLAQPLPMVEGKDVGDITKPIAKLIGQAIKQLNGNKRCMALIQQQKPADAVTAARTAVVAYPRATIARLCMARGFIILQTKSTTSADSARYADSVLAVSQAILQQDSLNIDALKYSATFYKFRGDTLRERQALLTLAQADANNMDEVRAVISSLASEGRVKDATPLLKDLLSKNPGDTAILHLAFIVYATAQDWQSVADVGSALVKADTNAADSSYFTRMAAAYDKLNQPLQAVDILTQATAKYPNNSYFWIYYATQLEKGAQAPQAIDAYRRVISLNPKDPTLLMAAYLKLANLYDQTNASDSLYTLVQRAAQIPGLDTANKTLVSRLALSRGNKLVQAATAGATPPPGEKLRSDLQYALKFLQLANQISPSVQAQFLMGAANFQIMQSATSDAETYKSCALSRVAQQAVTDATPGLQAGATNPDYQASAQSMLGYIPKFSPAIESYLKKFCK
ncbi:MAG TPA: hypothetical protein VNU46_09320 [Gemmatimonadaceae bacterium]|nr:hypothetical protein [Gemmatimonadaceae bacterium]